MIEFNGYLTGAPKKFLFKKLISCFQNATIFAFTMVLPFIILLVKTFEALSILYLYLAFFLCLMIVYRIIIPKASKSAIPKRIYIMDDKMVCIADNLTENRSVELVRKVFDYGEFYFISFYFGKISCYFICQKSLLTQGTIEDFEKLFDGKIVRKNENR